MLFCGHVWWDEKNCQYAQNTHMAHGTIIVYDPPPPWPSQTAQTSWAECDLPHWKVNWWRHNEYLYSHPSFSYSFYTHLFFKVRPVVWLSDRMWQDDNSQKRYEASDVMPMLFYCLANIIHCGPTFSHHLQISSTLIIHNCYPETFWSNKCRGPGAVVKTACLESRRCRLAPCFVI